MGREGERTEQGGKRGQRALDNFERAGADSFYDGRPSRVSGGERFAAAVSRPKPLHWTRILALGALFGAIAGVLSAIAVGSAPGVVLLAFVGAVAGLLVVTAFERAGAFRTVDEL